MAAAGIRVIAAGTDAATGTGTAGFLSGDAVEKLQARWQTVQVGFVDDPRHSVEEADALLEQAVTQFTESVTSARSSLRAGWQSGGPGSAADDSGTSTEDLRGTLREYRRLLNQLLAS